MSAQSFRRSIGELAPEQRGIVALDNMSDEVVGLVLSEIGEYFGMVKENDRAQSLGWQDAVLGSQELGFKLMADAKYHDSPETMQAEVSSTTFDEARFITIHASAGVAALEAAVEGRDDARRRGLEGFTEYDPLSGTLLGITVLTSISEEQCKVIYGASIKEKVLQFAGFAVEAGLEGIVCAGTDLQWLHAHPDTAKLIKVVPSIYLPGQEPPSGQARSVTPEQAMAEGADYVVAGRAVTGAMYRKLAAEKFLQGIIKGLG